MPKINVDCSYFNHPKTRRLKVYLNLEADVFPIRLWAFVAEYFPKDGILKGYSGAEIEGILGYNGTPGNLIRALETVGFLDKTSDNTYVVHDWEEHAGFIWNYHLAGKKGGKQSGISRRKNQSKRPFNDSGTTVQRFGQNRSTIELNGIELNKDIQPPKKPPVWEADLFQRFWQAYPRKVAVGAAKKAWNRLKPDQALLDKMLQVIAISRVKLGWDVCEPHFIPHAASWLNSERFNDILETVGKPVFDPNAVLRKKQELLDVREREYARLSEKRTGEP